MKTMIAKTSSRNDGKETLLVVDDDAEIRRLEVRGLSKLGYNVLQARGPAEALRLAAATTAINLLVTDFEMPEANGLELARQFRVVHPKAPVLMVSGSLQEIEGCTNGLDRFAFLAKPFSWDQLVEKVYTLLNSQRDALADSPSLQAVVQTSDNNDLTL